MANIEKKLTSEEIASVKGKGFLLNRGTDKFSGRLVSIGGVFSSKDLMTVAEIAEKYGSGKVTFTSRLSAEIVGIPFDKIDAACAYAAERGLYFGGTGAKIRPITACKGTTCIYGNYDTQELAKEIHEKFYIGYGKVKLPHKFKIGVGGCPNSCMKPSLNDFGIEGHRAPSFSFDDCRGCASCKIAKLCPSKACEVKDGKLSVDPDKCRECGYCLGKCPFGAVKSHDNVMYKIYVGGTWGKECRIGTPLSRMLSRDEIMPAIESTMLWFKLNAEPKERLGRAIDRIGIDDLEDAIFSGKLLERRDEILAADSTAK